MHPSDRKYAKTHEWAKVEGSKALVGISDHAQNHLGDIVFVDLPPVGKAVKKGETFCVVESVKAVADCYAPVSGTVTKVNEKLLEKPELLNQDPHGEAWIVELEMNDPSEVEELLDAVSYEKLCEEESGH